MNKLVIGITLFLAIFLIVYLYSNVSYWDVNRYIVTVGEDGELNSVSEKYFKDFEDRLTKKVEDKLKNVVVRGSAIRLAWAHGNDQGNDGWDRGCRWGGCAQGHHYLGVPAGSGDVPRMSSNSNHVHGGQNLKDYERIGWVVV
jgi:hypothetical protein